MINPYPLPQPLVPWYFRLNVGTLLGSTSSLINGYNYRHVTAPLDYDVEIMGVSANFDTSGVFGKVAVVQSSERWTPEQISLLALAGQITQAEPVLHLPVPYLLRRGEKIYVDLINNTGAPISNTILTIVGRKYTNSDACPAT
jgi:hypothetical protein